jgi:hypothetical protein
MSRSLKSSAASLSSRCSGAITPCVPQRETIDKALCHVNYMFSWSSGDDSTSLSFERVLPMRRDFCFCHRAVDEGVLVPVNTCLSPSWHESCLSYAAVAMSYQSAAGQGRPRRLQGLRQRPVKVMLYPHTWACHLVAHRYDREVVLRCCGGTPYDEPHDRPTWCDSRC